MAAKERARFTSNEDRSTGTRRRRRRRRSAAYSAHFSRRFTSASSNLARRLVRTDNRHEAVGEKAQAQALAAVDARVDVQPTEHADSLGSQFRRSSANGIESSRIRRRRRRLAAEETIAGSRAATSAHQFRRFFIRSRFR